METFWGKVRKGAQRGRVLGFPTANIAIHKEIPEGIYVSKVTVHQDRHDNVYNALTFIGSSKTFGETKVQAESYLLDFSGNVYGKFITVQLLKKIRDNEKFDSAESLKKQMDKDLVTAKKFFSE